MESWMLTRDRRRCTQPRIASSPTALRRQRPEIPAVPTFEARPGHSSACDVGRGVPSVWHTITPSNGSAAGRLPALPKVPEGLKGSCNAAWDLRPARWLHRADSPWLLFGVCSCRSPLGGIVMPVAEEEELKEEAPPAEAEAKEAEVKVAPAAAEVVETPVEGYKVIGMLADGRCLFRSIVYGAFLINGKEVPDETQQKELADDLRSHVVNELLNRRPEIEWFIEEDFDRYIRRIRQPYVWGGEPELLMASHVLRTPVYVYNMDIKSKKLVNIAKYGAEYTKNNENRFINVLFHGYGHYDALEILTDVK